MPKTKISEYSATANSNTDVASINIDEGCAPSGINNAIRAVMGHLKDFQQGTNGDPFNGPVNGTVGATTPSTGAFTTLSASGVFNNSRAAGADTYINHITTGINNTVMGFNNSGATNGSGVTNNTSYIGSLNAYSTWVVGNGATIAKFVSSAQGDQGLIVNGVVGIGTSSPAKRLDVRQAYTADTVVAQIGNTNNGNGSTPVATIFDFTEANGTAVSRISSIYTQSTGKTDLAFGTYNSGLSEKMRLDSSGNLGLGVTPSAWASYKALQVGSGFAAWSTGTTNARIFANTYYDGAYKYVGTGRATQYEQDGYHAWYTAPSWDGTGSPTITFTQAMTLDVSGNLLVGTTNTDPTFNRVNGAVLLSNGSVLSRSAGGSDFGSSSTSGVNISFYTDNGSSRVTAGNISSNGSTTTYGTASDHRMKTDVQPMVGAINKVLQLKPVTYKWKPEFAGTNENGQGFIAHELAEVVPDCVTGEKDAVDENGNPKYQGIDTSFLVATLTAAIQELKAEFDAYKASHP